MMVIIITMYAFISLVSSHKWSWYISETHTFVPLKSHGFFDIYKDFFHFPNYHSILFGKLYSLNRCDPSKKGKVPASRPGVSCPKYELLHLNHVLVPPQTPTHGVH